MGGARGACCSLMKPFKSIVIVKQPIDVIWRTIRDRLPEISAQLDDVASVEVLERRTVGDGIDYIVNQWTAKIRIPDVLASYLQPEMLMWIDRAEWNDVTHACTWTIEPSFFHDSLRCGGEARYEQALGGRGTKITFEGELQVDTSGLVMVPQSLKGIVAMGVESLVILLIPKNFRKVAEAAASLGSADRAGQEPSQPRLMR